jgi:L-fuconolactonase
MTAQPATPAAPVRQEWLDRLEEEIIEPNLPIVDPHHHLWDRPGWRYLLDELLADLNRGHNIVATVYQTQSHAQRTRHGARHLARTGRVCGRLSAYTFRRHTGLVAG